MLSFLLPLTKFNFVFFILLLESFQVTSVKKHKALGTELLGMCHICLWMSACLPLMLQSTPNLKQSRAWNSNSEHNGCAHQPPQRWVSWTGRPQTPQTAQHFKTGLTNFHSGDEKEQCYIREEERNKWWWQLCWFIVFLNNSETF